MKKYLKIGILATVLVLIVKYFTEILSFLSMILDAATPLITGFVLAYILNLLLKRVEKIYFPHTQKKLLQKSRRPVCMILSLALLVCILGLVVNIVVPELSSSFRLIGQEIPGVAERIQQWLLAHSDKIPSLQKHLKDLDIDWASLSQRLIRLLTIGAGGVFNSVIAVLSAAFGIITNFVIGFIFAMYLLFNKERLIRQIQKLMQVWIRPEKTRKIMHIARVANHTFSSFIVGQCTEAVILGLLCTLGMMLFRFPYAAMTGAVVGVTALIPIVGAYIGAVVGAFMILTVNPLQAVFFVIFLVVLQQLEGNLIYPRVVGTSIGLPSMWVLASITIGGGLLGITGMILGVPTAATVYKLLGETVNQKINRQQKAGGKKPRYKKPENRPKKTPAPKAEPVPKTAPEPKAEPPVTKE